MSDKEISEALDYMLYKLQTEGTSSMYEVLTELIQLIKNNHED